MRIKPLLDLSFLVGVARFMLLRTHRYTPSEVKKMLTVSEESWRKRLGLPRKQKKPYR